MSDNGAFCLLPWLHMHFWPNGNAYPCCLSDSNQPLGNTNTRTIQQMWNDQPMRELRQRMLNGERSSSCQRCYDLEAAGSHTLRQQSLIDYGHHLHRADHTAADGTVEDVRMAYLDVRFSNICNLRCRTCSHDLSSGWYDDTVARWPSYDQPRIMNINRSGDFWQQLLPLLPTVEEAHFAGGESLITDEHYRMLDHWIAQGRTNIRLRYTTNFTVLDYKQRDLFELWRQFPDLRVAASLDASGARAEYLRKNLSWAEIEQNRRRMLNQLPDVYFEITPTVSIYNLLHLPDFHRDWVDQGLLGTDAIRINLLGSPAHSSVKVLPHRLKSQAKAAVEAHLAWLRSRAAAADTLAAWQGVIDFMLSEDHSHLLPQWLEEVAVIDRQRGERFTEVFPELASLVEPSKTWCALPWTNINTTPQGQIKLCCNITHPSDVLQSAQGALTWDRDSIQDIWQGEHLRSVRASMLAGQPVASCAVCYNQEALGNRSPRISANQAYQGALGSELGETADLPVSFELRTSTRCNLSCATCWAGSSDQIARQRKMALEWAALPSGDPWHLAMPAWLQQSWQQEQQLVDHSNSSYASQSTSLKNFTALAPTLQRLYITGGEPTMDSSINRYLDSLLDSGNSTCHVSFTTNCTLWNGKLMRRMTSFANSEIQLSIDAHGAANDLIRQGSNWHEVTENVSRYLSEPGLQTIKIYTVVSALNCLELEQLLKWIINTVNLHGRRVTWFPIVLESPGFQQITVLPLEARLAAADRLEQLFTAAAWPEHFCVYRDGLAHCLRALRDTNVVPDTEGWFKLRERLDHDDRVRQRLHGANSPAWRETLTNLGRTIDKLHEDWPNTSVPRG